MRDFVAKISLTALFVLAIFSASAAEKVTFEANSPLTVAVGEPFRVEFALNAMPDDGTFKAPAFEGFDVIAGPAEARGQSIQIVNNAMTRVINYTITYVLVPQGAGNVTVGAAEIAVEGTTYRTKPLAIEVVDEGKAPGGGGSAAGGQPQRREEASSESAAQSKVAKDDILLRAIVSRTSVFKGEPLRVTFKLYERVPVVGYNDVKFPSFNGFWAQELNVDGYKWQRETYKGKVYDARVIKETLLYPQQLGKLYIEQFSLTVIAQIVTQNPQGGSLFDNFFGNGQSVEEVRKTLTAAPIQITVKDFPTGAPASFNGAVGRFQMQGDLDHDVLAANSSGVYQLKISGNGNLPLIQAPKVTMPSSFEQYNMKTTESLTHNGNGITGYRQFDYPFIPRAEGSYSVGPVEFSYFDPEQAKYVTLSAPQQNVEIKPDSTGGTSAGTGVISGVSKEDLKILDKDIRFIRIGEPQFHRRGHLYFGSWAYWLALAVLTTITAALYFYLRKHLKELQNTSLVRHKRANKVALQRLKAALGYMTADEEKPFYEEMLKALWGYMSDKLNIPVANLTKDNIREELLKRSVDAEYINRFIEIISDCEYAQYSPSSSGQMTEIYNGAVKMLSKFESLIKK